MPTRGADRRSLGAWLLLGSPFWGCAAPAEPGLDAPAASATVAVGWVPPSGDVVTFRYPDVRGGELSSEKFRDRISVIAFITTYDLPSQAQVRFLSQVWKNHAPRINAALLVLEQPENLPLVEAYANSLQIPYPVAMADAATIKGAGPFAGLHHVPSIVILDRKGYERFRHLGALSADALEAALTKVESESGVAGNAPAK